MLQIKQKQTKKRLKTNDKKEKKKEARCNEEQNPT